MELTRRILAIPLKPADLRNSWRNQDLVLRLHRFMLAEGGIGLAANQVGLRDRCFVMSIN
jgi:peptide deformylase